ncbi:hypothetical protein Gp_1 [Bacillus phage vB_Bacillus_1020A]|uniref:hypothetical protein n=1 Tax=Robertmurraya sp. DFI.2.37 TaxID=3031819 RepID=UPI0012466080|nr:hypothetical protein [Robertmurraya sp. DFI.2.37]MDF1511469.1 hypothetical protein [Robertmurraya sp. DFI.2.37]QIW89275.1 hypothetical protein Gp_1 [Bacillus phage vB_Bacillus_1020A]
MSWEQTIKKGDIVRDLETGQYEVISVIQWEHNRYQFKWRSNWRYGTDRIEKVEPFDFIEFANGLKRIVEQQQQDIERLENLVETLTKTNQDLAGAINNIQELD